MYTLLCTTLVFVSDPCAHTYFTGGTGFMDVR